MALLKGINGKCPCPVCQISGTELANLSTHYPLRHASQAQHVMENKNLGKTAKSAELKVLGLRAIEVICRVCTHGFRFRKLI